MKPRKSRLIDRCAGELIACAIAVTMLTWGFVFRPWPSLRNLGDSVDRRSEYDT